MDRLTFDVSGVRGVIGTALTPVAACQFGCAFGTMLGAGKTVVVARDPRRSGPMIRNAVTAGLLAAGLNVVDLGVVTTPGAAFMTARLQADGGVVVTACDRPIEQNGLKFLQPGGACLTAGGIAKLQAIRRSERFVLADAEHQGAESQDKTTHGRHVDAVAGAVDALGIAARRFKVVLDSVNGAGCVVTPMFLGRLGCEVAHLNAEATGRFAHRPELSQDNLRELCEAVRKHAAAVGFAQDADADRLALVDEGGRFIGAEVTLALTTSYVLRHRRGKVAAGPATSRMIDDVAAAAGCEVVRTDPGEANIAEAMQRQQCIFGGEGGGVIEPRIAPVPSSLVAIAYVLQLMAETGKSVSRLVAELPTGRAPAR